MSSATRFARRAIKFASVASDRLTPRLTGARLLIYHQIGAGNGQEMDLRPEDFLRQMEWLSDSGRVARLEEALDNRDDPEDRYVITFDDGYDDMFRNGYPILRELGLPFVVYLTSSPIETRRPLRDDGRSVPIDWDQVGEMMASGLMTIGAHTHSHPDFRHLDARQIEEEVVTSNELIELRTGAAPRHFTYTWGYWTEAADAVVRRHYDTATVAGCRGAIGAPDHAIPRLPIQLSDGWTFFAHRLRGGFKLEDSLRRRMAGYGGP